MAQNIMRVSCFSSRLVCSRSTCSTFTIPIFLAPNLAATSYSKQFTARHVRHASTTAQRTSVTTKQSLVADKEGLNPPASTRPPELSTPTRQPGQSAPAYYFALGKSYLAFYKTGVKAVWGNYKTARAIRETRLKGRGLTPDQALETGQLTRSEWQLLRRASADVRKIPLFALVFMACGEFTPLVVLVISGVVPKTCHIPRQLQKEREKLETRRRTSFRNGDSVVNKKELEGGKVMASANDTQTVVSELRWEQLLHIARALGLYNKLWDTLWDYPPQWVLQRRVRRSLDYLRLDDSAIERHGGVAHLDPEEAKMAAEERGLDILGRDDAKVKEVLRRWLQARKQQSIPYLILTRPNVWKV